MIPPYLSTFKKGGAKCFLSHFLIIQYNIMDSKMSTFISIMVFYIVLSYIIFPLAFYYLVDKSLSSAGNGFVVGSIISILLWYNYGKKLITN
jgi:hypothetical protein